MFYKIWQYILEDEGQHEPRGTAKQQNWEGK